MKTEKELNDDIVKLTMTILEQYPELSEYLGEMPVTLPDTKDPEINSRNLSAYYDSLSALLENYIREHPREGIK
jgi:hypothetical protein